MQTTTTLPDPRTEAENARKREHYHAEEADKQARWAAAAGYAAKQSGDPEVISALRELAEQTRLMATFHAGQAAKSREDKRAAQDRANDHEQKHAKALRAAADAADMAGAPTLATELNRRAAEAEGYNPDAEDGDEPWYHPQPDERDTNPPSPKETTGAR